MEATLGRRMAAESLGTFWLVFAGCGSAVVAAAVPDVGIGFVGVALAFGLSVVTGAYAVGHISGAHFNPAISIALAVAGRFPRREVGHYVGAQLVGGAVGALFVYLIAMGRPAFSLADGLATNGYGQFSPGGYSLGSAFLAELVLTFVFLWVVMGVTDEKAPKGFAPMAIGLTLTLIHLIAIPITNVSVNPARSTSPALFVGADALGQLWLFWVAPILGGVLGALSYNALVHRGPLLGHGRMPIVPAKTS